jgi:hypothetical protein
MVGLDGKLQIGPFVETGESEGPFYFFPFVLVNGKLSGLARFKCISFRLPDLI